MSIEVYETMSTATMWLLLFVVAVLALLIAALTKTKFTVQKISIIGNDASGAIYGANRLVEYFRMNNSLEIPYTIVDAPEMKLRGACVGLQKTVYLPGHKVYEYPYTPENFPWFYDKELWIKYLQQ